MLVIVIQSPDALSQFLSKKPLHKLCVIVLVPGAEITKSDLDQLLKQYYVIEFLEEPKNSLSVIDYVCQQFTRIFDSGEQSLVFINRSVHENDISETTYSRKLSRIVAAFNTEGWLTDLVVSARAMSNPQLRRLIQMLQTSGIDDRKSIALLRGTFEGATK